MHYLVASNMVIFLHIAINMMIDPWIYYYVVINMIIDPRIYHHVASNMIQDSESIIIFALIFQ